MDAGVLSTPDISDHRLVRCKAVIQFLHRKSAPVKTARYDDSRLNDPTIAKSFSEQVTENLENASTENSQVLMNHIENALKKAANNVLGKTAPSVRNDWITDSTKKYIHRKHEIRKEHGPSSMEYKIAKCNAKKLCKIDKDTHIDNLHRNLKNLPESQQYYRVIKMLKAAQEKTLKSWSVKSVDNVVLTEHSEIIERWHEFYQNLYRSERSTFDYFEEEDEIPEILDSELQHALKTLKSGKAPGPDGITTEMLRAGGSHLHELLRKLANLIIATRYIPEQLVISEIILLFKKGDLLDCGNFRPISLLCHVYKLLMLVIYNRIKTPLTNALQSEQAAYQRGRGTVEQVQILQQVIEKCNEFQRPSVICFVDFTKAFDSIDQQKLWNTLKEYTSLNPGYINLLAKLYEQSKTRVRTGIGLTEIIDLLKGVKQGDVASAILFCIVLMVILLKTFEGLDFGISIGGSTHSDEAYADDVALITESTMEMNIVLERLRHFAAEFGLSVNIKKTKVMLIGTHGTNDPLCVIDTKELEVVTSFEYLGRVLSSDSDDHKAVTSRIGKGWAAFNKVKSIITSKQVPMKTKARTYETYIVSCVLYASETIKWSNNHLSRIQKFENDIMRWMTNKRLNDRVSIKRLYEITGIQSLVGKVKSRKARWFGHIKRSDLPVRITVEGMISGKRGRGRPRRRWRDDITEWLDLNWDEINLKVQDRSSSRKICLDLQH